MNLALCCRALAIAMALCFIGWIADGQADIWINEFHYDDEGADEGEFIEVVVAPNMSGVDTNTVTISLYNGNDGAVYDSATLDTFTTGDLVSGFQFYSKAIAPIQNGAPDGLALDIGGSLVEFLSYEGTFVGVGGPANGVGSTDIGVGQAAAPAGSSLGLTGGPGSQSGDFSWAAFDSGATVGSINGGQSLVPEPGTWTMLVLGALALAAARRRRIG